MTEEERQEALAWLDEAADPGAGNAQAQRVRGLIEQAASRENTVIGMTCDPSMTVKRIRDYLMQGVL